MKKEVNKQLVDDESSESITLTTNEQDKKTVPYSESPKSYCCNKIEVIKLKNGKTEIKFAGYQWSKGKWAAVAFGVTLNVTYSLLVSLIFASLASERSKEQGWKITYAASSFVMNFPLAVLSGFGTFDFFAKFSQRPALYKVMTILGFVLATCTTLAGFSLSYDGIYKAPVEFVQKFGLFGVGLFAFNTLSTRFVTSAGLLNSLATGAWELFSCGDKRETNKAMRMLQSDMQKYGHLAKNETFLIQSNQKEKKGEINAEKIKTIANNFYGLLKQKNVKPRSNLREFFINWAPNILVKGSLIYAAYLQFPVWLELSQRGVQGLVHHFDPNASLEGKTLTALTYVGATSTEMFYLRMVWNFLDTVSDFAFQPYKNSGSMTSLIAPGLLLTIGLVLGWFSGEGVGEEMVKTIPDLTNQNHGQQIVARDFYESPMGFFMRLSPTTMLLWASILMAGIVANGSAAWKTLSQRVPYFEDKTDMAEEKKQVNEFIEKHDFSQNTANSIIEARKEWADNQTSYSTMGMQEDEKNKCCFSFCDN